jgi:hypothetical protein
VDLIQQPSSVCVDSQQPSGNHLERTAEEGGFLGVPDHEFMVS